MLIKISAEVFNSQYALMSLADYAPDEFNARKTEDGAPKLAPNGLPTYSSPLKLLAVENGKAKGEVRGASVHVCAPVPLEFGKTYIAEGNVFITHYAMNARNIGVSIVIEKVGVRATSRPTMQRSEA